MVTSLTNKKKFEHSVNILLKAFLNNTLSHQDCGACAVGNLMSHELGRPLTTIEKSMGYGWATVFFTPHSKMQILHPERLHNEIPKRLINVTGYHWTDLAKIEFAFESCDNGESLEDKMFNGLMAVVDVLAEIHEIDLTTVKETKELFV